MKYLRADRVKLNEINAIAKQFKFETKILKRLSEEERISFVKSLALTNAIERQTEIVRALRKKIQLRMKRTGVLDEAA